MITITAFRKIMERATGFYQKGVPDPGRLRGAEFRFIRSRCRIFGRQHGHRNSLCHYDKLQRTAQTYGFNQRSID